MFFYKLIKVKISIHSKDLYIVEKDAISKVKEFGDVLKRTAQDGCKHMAPVRGGGRGTKGLGLFPVKLKRNRNIVRL